MSETNNIQSAIDAGRQLGKPHSIYEGDSRFYSVLVPDGSRLQTIDLEELEDKLAPRPRRKTGTVHVQEAESFIAYIGKHRIADTEVYGDAVRRQLVGVINAHGESEPSENNEGEGGHRDHRVQLELVHSDEWKIWTDRNAKWMDQIQFAEHLEDNGLQVVYPDAATMLEIAQHFHAAPSGSFRSAQRLSSGEVSLQYEEQVNAKAGELGDIEIPTVFTLALRPFVGSEAVEVDARFRYRIRQGQLTLSYALLNTQQIVHDAFNGIVATVRNSIEPPVYVGRPE